MFTMVAVSNFNFAVLLLFLLTISEAYFRLFILLIQYYNFILSYVPSLIALKIYFTDFIYSKYLPKCLSFQRYLQPSWSCTDWIYSHWSHFGSYLFNLCTSLDLFPDLTSMIHYFIFSIFRYTRIRAWSHQIIGPLKCICIFAISINMSLNMTLSWTVTKKSMGSHLKNPLSYHRNSLTPAVMYCFCLFQILFIRCGDLSSGKAWFLYAVGTFIIIECIFTNILLFRWFVSFVHYLFVKPFSHYTILVSVICNLPVVLVCWKTFCHCHLFIACLCQQCMTFFCDEKMLHLHYAVLYLIALLQSDSDTI